MHCIICDQVTLTYFTYLHLIFLILCAHVDGHQLRSTLPYIRTDIPVVIVFRALGFISDK